MAKPDEGLTRATRLLGGPVFGQSVNKIGLLPSILLPLAPFIVLFRFGGFALTDFVHLVLGLVIGFTACLPVASYINGFVQHRSKIGFVRAWTGSTIFLLVFIVAAIFAGNRAGWNGAEAVAAIGVLFLALHRGVFSLLRSRLFKGSPARALGASFILVILVGALFLAAAPNATQGDDTLSFTDALFTATSATCVTGLEVVSTSGTLSLFGQSIVLLLIQVGGLGIMTLGTFLLLTSGHRLGLSGRAMVRGSLNVEGQQGMARLLVAILGFTFAFEIIGAFCFYPWYADETRPMFFSLFHSISAFCNAGFALHSNSFGNFAVDPMFNLVAVILITAGGLGFTVLRELKGRFQQRLKKKQPKPLSLHTRLVLVTSVALVVIGALGFFVLERNGVLADLSTPKALVVAIFQSVSTRTAGFSTVAFSGEGGLSQATRFFLVPLMWIGASPGSTGGGLKTVTLAVLAIGVVAQMRRRKHAEILGRRIPDDQLRQAATIALLYGGVLVAAILALLISEGSSFALNELLFEAVSAVGTVGYSCGVSGSEHLSDFGKIVITILMFVGRLGPLTLVLVLGRNRSHVAIDYPEERVMIG